MFRLLRIEFLKIKTYKTFWIFLVSYVLLILLFGSSSNSTVADPAAAIFGFPSVWNSLAQKASFLNILLGILVILLITNEFTFKTFRQNIIDGLSREQAVTAKFIFIIAIAITCILFLFIYGLTKGLMKGDFPHLGEI